MNGAAGNGLHIRMMTRHGYGVATSMTSELRARTPQSSAEDLLELDRRHVWHPYGPMPAAPPPLPVVSAEGVRLRLADGRELVDGMASWWCADPRLPPPGARRRRARAARPDGARHVRRPDPRAGGAPGRAARRDDARGARARVLRRLGVGRRSRSRIKMCLQARPGRARRLLTVRGGYHGDTFGAMAVCDPVGGMHALFARRAGRARLRRRARRAVLDDAYAAAAASALVERHADELAGGDRRAGRPGRGRHVVLRPARCCALLRELCDGHGLLLVARRDRHRLRPHRRRCSRASTRASRPTSCASARRSPAAT